MAGGGPSTQLMGQFPLSLIPTFFVPVFILLHLVALARAKDEVVLALFGHREPGEPAVGKFMKHVLGRTRRPQRELI